MINTRSSRAAASSMLVGTLALVLAGCSSNEPTDSGSGSGSGSAAGAAKVAFLMPDQGSTRYEEHDRPGFEAQMKKLCPDCTVLYNNADGDAAKQQQQFNAAITEGAKAIVLDAVDTSAAASLVQQAQSQGIKIVAYDRPIPDTPADFYVSYDNEKIGQLIAASLVKHHGRRRCLGRRGRRAPGQRVTHGRRCGTHQEGHARGTGHRVLQDAR